MYVSMLHEAYGSVSFKSIENTLHSLHRRYNRLIFNTRLMQCKRKSHCIHYTLIVLREAKVEETERMDNIESRRRLLFDVMGAKQNQSELHQKYTDTQTIRCLVQ